MPTGNPEKLKTEEEIAATQRENDRQFEEQADVRNQNRSFVKKVFGAGKMSGIDIAHEEALRVNRLVDQKIEREGGETSAQTSADEILSSTEFGRKDDATIKSEEFLRAKNPDIAKSIRGGDIASARAAFEKLSEKVKDDNEKRSLRKGFEKMVSDQVDTLVQSKDAPGMTRFVLENRLEDVGIKNIALMPEEIIYLPEVQSKFVGKIKQEFGSKAEYPQDAVRWVKSFTDAGLMKPEAAQELFGSQEIQDRMKNKIKSEFGSRGEYANDAKRWAQQYVASGLMKKEDVDQYLKELGVK